VAGGGVKQLLASRKGRTRKKLSELGKLNGKQVCAKSGQKELARAKLVGGTTENEEKKQALGKISQSCWEQFYEKEKKEDALGWMLLNPKTS